MAPVIDAVFGADHVLVSLASAWEIAIKRSTRRLAIEESVEDGIADAGFEPLPISFRHVERVATLPLHHRDPFDRMLVAQALDAGLTLVTHDRQLAPYGVPILWA